MLTRLPMVAVFVAVALLACGTSSKSRPQAGAGSGPGGSAGSSAGSNSPGAGGSAAASGNSSTSAGAGSSALGGAGGGDAGAGTTGGGSGGKPSACQRPAGMPAVSLTYDDALATHVSTVGPALKAHDLKATFFVTDVRANQGPWAALRAAGHELGSHTFKHPCPKVNSFVAPGDANEDYDAARMTKELDDSIAMLTAMGQPAPFTFAYPCGVDWLGEPQQSYAPLVAARFSAARGVTPGLVKAGVNLVNVPATFSTGDGAELIAIAEGAKVGAAWVVFGFHGVGGDHSAVAADAHEALLSHLDERRNEIYVGTFGELAACLAP